MPQVVFDGCALTVAMAAFAGVNDSKIAKELAEQYSGRYADTRLEDEILNASKKIVVALPNMMVGDYSPEQLAGACKTLTAALTKFNPDGSKRKRGLFGGTLFNYEKRQIEGKAERCLATVAAYHIAITTGSIDARALD